MSVRNTSIDLKLIQSARKEFKKNGFIKADLKTICDNAGVTTGAVYKRYKGKEELFQAVVKETVEMLDGFVSVRADMDFSEMTDEEVRDTWKMDEVYILDLFKLLWKIRDDFVLLLDMSAGTVYEKYGHEFAFRMTDAYMQYYLEAKKRGLAKADITQDEMHVLCTSFWTAIYEPFVHKMTWKEIEKHCRVMCRFYDWTKALEMK
ncbi:TetR/AcrR family transcriptional regulator [Eubacterium sp.]|uniref:TetR/AcrR family transcriptional regulator n=1 Tax=Eubacterium sp. TaxID=142586 RepID=UPI0025F2B624|nr:TetR/AcrR family transcriptional regulator [Eubacterium sp.]MCR5628857.1 TetR/AcrR family transcriptional regulator [Eubacterium sp.]